MNLRDWFKLVLSHPRGIVKLPFKVLFATILIILLTPFRMYEYLKFSRRIRRHEIEKPPIFIIGHWRSGTTHLHKLLTTNREVGYGDLAEVLFPHMVLGKLNNFITHTMLNLVLPNTRMQDNVSLASKMPHEHEYALMQMNMMSPYLFPFMPKDSDRMLEYVSLDEIPEANLIKWKNDFHVFVKKLSYKNKGKQLILKSPVDTARVDLILELFPDAKFVHLTRNPYNVFPSTKKMLALYTSKYSIQKNGIDLDELILDIYNELYTKYLDTRDLLEDVPFIEITYDELIDRPRRCMRSIYQELEIPGIDAALLDARAYLYSVKNYQPNEYHLSQKQTGRIRKYWNAYIKHWNYSKPKRFSHKKRLPKQKT